MALHAHPEPIPAWRTILAELKRLVGEPMYDIWIAPIELEAWDGELLLLKAPADTQGWVSDRFGHVLDRCAKEILGAGTRIAFDGARQSATRTAHRSPQPAHSETGGSFNPRYSFDQFIIGAGNQLAHSAALAVAENPGQAYNPLFLHAPPGLGKTHLLQAIGNYVHAFGGGATVRYTTAEAFTNQFISALSTRALQPFKHAYRHTDVLLIDDVQFLASKAKTEEEFFHTFNALYENGRQLVLTCDRLPRSLVALEERLRERFEAGLVAEMVAPNHATRVAILRKRAELDRIAIEDGAVLDLIAERVTSNVRTLEGALIRVVAHHSLTQRPIDLALATEVMDGMYPSSAGRRTPTIEEIQQAVSDFYEISVAELISPSRKANIAWARQVAIHLARDLSGTSLQAIGTAFGGRNHGTVLHACKRVSDRVHNDQQAANEVGELDERVRARHADRHC